MLTFKQVTTVCTLVVLLRLTSSSATGGSYLTLTRSALQSTSGWLKKTLSLNMSDEEANCFNEDKILYEGKCYSILSDSPCGDNEWLVLNKTEAVNGELKGACSPKKCSEGQYYMATVNKCVDQYDIENITCPHLEFSYNLFGEGRCHCNGTQLFMVGSNDSVCYEIFERGPCPKGHLFVPVSDVFDTVFGECRPVPCAQSEFRNENVSLALNMSKNVKEQKCGNVNSTLICSQFQLLIIKHAFANGNLLKGKVILHCYEDLLSNKFGINVTAVSDNCVPNNSKECVKALKSSEEIKFDFLDK